MIPTDIVQNRYRLIREIGKGSFSTVYEGIDTTEARPVAVKLFEYRGGLERFLRVQQEVSMLAKLNHPRIVKFYEVGQHNGTCYLIMELIPGVSLATYIKNRTALDPGEAVSIVMQITEALEHVHQHGMIHRDLKPANIMLARQPEDSVKVLDFGLAWVVSMADRFASKSVVGSFFYMAPEQTGILQVPIDYRADLYALGVMFYELLTGAPPFQGTDAGALIHQHVAKLPAPPRQVNPNIPPLLEEIVLKLLRKDPQERYQTATGLLEDLTEYYQAVLAGSESVHFPLARADRPGQPISFHARVVGRHSELAELQTAFDRAAAGHGQIVMIAGEPGIGKSRLVNEMRGYVNERGGAFISGKCNEYSRAFPYSPFVEAVQEYLQQVENLNPEKRRLAVERIKGAIGEMGEELTRILPEIKTLIGEPPHLATVSWEEDKQVERFLSVASDFLVSLGNPRLPVLLFLDDLQWIDGGTLQLLERTFAKVPSSHLFIVGTYRDSQVTQGHPLHTFLQIWKNAFKEIKLQFLSLQDLRTLLLELLNMQKAEARLLAQVIYEKTTGNPFFILEMLKAFLQGGVLALDRDGWKFDPGKVDQVSVSSQVDEVIVQRLTHIEEESLDVLSYAAVIGRDFTFEDLLHITPQEPAQILRNIDEASHYHIILPRVTPTGEQGYTFAHDKILETLYERIDPAIKQELHQKIAESLEGRYRDRLQDVIFELAIHFIRGTDQHKALRYSITAGDLAKQTYANSEAAHFYETALRLMEEGIAIEGASAAQLSLSLKEKLGDVNFFLGRYGDANKYYFEVRPFLTEKPDISRVETKIGTVFFRQGSPEETLEHLGNGLSALGIRQPKTVVGVMGSILWETVKQAGHTYLPRLFLRKRSEDPRKLEAVRLFEPLFYYYYFIDMKRSIQVHLKQLNVAEQLGDIEFLTIAYVNHEKVCSAIGMHRRALKYAEKALRLRERPEQGPRAAGEALLAMGMAHYYRAEWNTAMDYFLKAADEMMKVGNLWQVEVAYGHLSLVHLAKGEFEKTIECGKLVQRIAEAVKNIHGFGWAQCIFAFGYLPQGRITEALNHAQQAVRQCEVAGDNLITAMSLRLVGEIYFKKGQIDEAMTALEKSRAIIEQNTLLHDLSTGTYVVLAEAYLQAARADEAKRKVYLKKARRCLTVALILAKLFKNWSVPAYRVKGMYEWTVGKKIPAKRSLQKSLDIATELGARYELGRTYLEFGRCLLNKQRS